MPGTHRTRQSSPQHCQELCAKMTGCGHFSYWSDGGCLLTSGGAHPVKYHGGVLSGGPSCGSTADTYKEPAYKGPSVMKVGPRGGMDPPTHVQQYNGVAWPTMKITDDKDLGRPALGILQNPSESFSNFELQVQELRFNTDSTTCSFLMFLLVWNPTDLKGWFLGRRAVGLASGAPHLCYWRLGRLDRHTPRTNDPATWRNIRHLESKTSRQAGYVGVQQEGYAMIHNMSRVKTCQNCHLASRPPCSTHSILIPTELFACPQCADICRRGTEEDTLLALTPWQDGVGLATTDTMMACFAGAAPGLQPEFFSERKLMFSLPLEAKLEFWSWAAASFEACPDSCHYSPEIDYRAQARCLWDAVPFASQTFKHQSLRITPVIFLPLPDLSACQQVQRDPTRASTLLKYFTVVRPCSLMMLLQTTTKCPFLKHYCCVWGTGAKALVIHLASFLR